MRPPHRRPVPASRQAGRILRFSLLALAMSVAACARLFDHGQVQSPTIAEDVAARMHPPGAIVLDSVLLVHEHQSVLEALKHGLPNLLVQPTNQCPILALRQTRGLPESSNPQVYVNGTRTANTCILETVPAQDVAFIEVYPTGVTTRPGYATSAYGLILLFMRSH